MTSAPAPKLASFQIQSTVRPSFTPEMFIARVEILHQWRSEERNPTRPSARKHISAPPNAAGVVCSSSYKHATPNGVKPVTLFLTPSVADGSRSQALLPRSNEVDTILW